MLDKPCNCILFHLTSIDKPPRQSDKAAHRFLGCAVTRLSSWLASPFQRSLKSALHLSTERCVTFPHWQAHLETWRIPILHLCFHDKARHLLYDSSILFFFSFFNACLQGLVIVKRKNYYLSLVLMAGTGEAETWRSCFCNFFAHMCFTVQQVVEDLNQN